MCLKNEATESDIARPDFYLGGEVELDFARVGSIFITWDENGGWQHHFSVKVTTKRSFLEDYLEPFNASTSPTWNPHIGDRVQSCRVLGWDGVPHVVSIQFSNFEVFVGDGHKDRFGDGDDVLVRTALEAKALPEMEGVQTLWMCKST